jgi:precorrin-6A synthase
VRQILVIGIGAGNPDHLTFQGAKAISRADVVFLIDKATADDLVAVRQVLLDRHARIDHRLVTIPDPARDRDPEDYQAAVAAWHRARAERIGAAIRDELDESSTGVFLVWGDPSLYDSTLRVLEAIDGLDIVDVEVEVIPGVTSVSALAAAHRTALHGVGEPVVLTTGRRLADAGTLDAPNTVVLLDGQEAYRSIDPDGIEVLWGAYLGMDGEVTIRGPLAEVADRISQERADAREANGWIMDAYLLRSTDPPTM